MSEATLAAAEALLADTGESGAKRARTQGASQASAGSGDGDMLQMITCLSLMKFTDLQNVLNSSSLVILIRSEEMQQKVLKAKQLSQEKKPEQSEEKRKSKNFTPHALKSFQYFMHSYILIELKKVAKGDPWSKAALAIGKLLEMSEEDLKDELVDDQGEVQGTEGQTAPKDWKGRQLVELTAGPEYDAVTRYFLATVGRNDVTIQGLSRVQNPEVYKACQDDNGFGSPTVMFHGCRSRQNEASIVKDGFQVSACVSGGQGFGTWFAYGAAYSNGSFVFQDSSGRRHIFVCVVSDRYVRLDNATMRVVGQGCAYPLWLLTFTQPSPPPLPSLPATTRGGLRGPAKSAAAPQKFFVARGGAWVAIDAEKCRRPRGEEGLGRDKKSQQLAALKHFGLRSAGR